MDVHSGLWTPADRVEGQYREVPFELPAGCPGVTVELAYSGGVLDLGCAGAGGFRGWSGGSRSRFAITPEKATPGYLSGDLEPGAWAVWLGLHRVPPDGVPYEVRIELGSAIVEADPPAPPVPERPPTRELPAEPGLRWLAGDLHAHTLHSDGSLSVPELAAVAVSAGLDFLAVTDHNTTSHHTELPSVGAKYGVLLVPGQEVTTDRGHANAFGDVGWIDFRRPADAWVSDVDGRGGLLSVNHPLAADCAWRWPLTTRPPLAEIWHWTWADTRWGGPIAWWTAWDLATVPVGGSDFHSPAEGRPLGRPCTWVQCTGQDVLGGLRAGRTAISADRDGPVLLRVGDELVAVGADGLLLADPSGRWAVVRGDRATFPAVPGPCWLEDATTRVHALTA